MSTTKNAQIFRIFTIILAVIMFSAAFTVLSLQRDGYAYGTGETGQITASSLYVRSGPGTNYSKIGSLKKGKTVRSRQDVWHKCLIYDKIDL